MEQKDKSVDQEEWSQALQGHTAQGIYQRSAGENKKSAFVQIKAWGQR